MKTLITWTSALMIWSLLVFGLAGDFGTEVKWFSLILIILGATFGISNWWNQLVSLLKALWAEREEE